MALESATVSIENNEFDGYIEIQSESNVSQLPTAIRQIDIYRGKQGILGTSKLIFSKELSTANDLNFTISDYTSLSGENYSYHIQLTDGDGVAPEVVEFQTYNDVACLFNGLFIGNTTRHYLAQGNNNLSRKRNTQVNYVVTLSSRTPYRVSNAAANYTTGECNGLFFKYDESRNIIPDYNNAYSEEIIDFLLDGTEKILKTADGQIWYVFIDGNISIGSNDGYFGYNVIKFNWTEAGDVPEFNYGI